MNHTLNHTSNHTIHDIQTVTQELLPGSSIYGYNPMSPPMNSQFLFNNSFILLTLSSMVASLLPIFGKSLETCYYKCLRHFDKFTHYYCRKKENKTIIK